MSTQTSRLKLTKPATTENWDVTNHFNGNMDKIDDFAGEITIDLGSNLASVSAVETGLNNLVSTYTDRAVRSVSFTCASGVESPFTNASYGGTFVRLSSTRARVILMRSGYDEVITGWLGNNGWTWESLALNRQIGGVTFSKGSLPTNASVDFNIQNGGRCVIIFIDSTNTRQAGYIVSANGSGAIQHTALATGTDLSISTTTNKFTVTKTQGSTPMYLIINLQGAMPTVS